MAMESTIGIPDGVEVKMDAGVVRAKGGAGEGSVALHEKVVCEIGEKSLSVKAADAADKEATVMAGTMRALVSNLVQGVHSRFEKKLELVGVGYRAQKKGKVLNLQLGYSHPIDYPVPETIEIDTPSQTEIIVKGVNKQEVGQVAAEIRNFRPPEPYKGKGVKYAGERILRKDAKKK